MKQTEISDKFAARFGIGCLIILGVIVLTLCIILIAYIVKL
jgi:hypothetical protein